MSKIDWNSFKLKIGRRNLKWDIPYFAGSAKMFKLLSRNSPPLHHGFQDHSESELRIRYTKPFIDWSLDQDSRPCRNFWWTEYKTANAWKAVLHDVYFQKFTIDFQEDLRKPSLFYGVSQKSLTSATLIPSATDFPSAPAPKILGSCWRCNPTKVLRFSECSLLQNKTVK